ncbi:MAG: DUF3472 domain-containing protein [Bacteroidetes bacterium]|nr:DUF3472 domain-containing protein [Bacteroidota bacterium]
MKKIFSCAAFLFILSAHLSLYAQTVQHIPAYTAYAVPVEESNEDDESNIFSQKDGIQHWSDPAQQIQFYFNLRQAGQLNLALTMKNEAAGNVLTITAAGKSFTVAVPKSKTFKTIPVGTVAIKEPGFYSVFINAKNKKGTSIAAIQSLDVSGAATVNMHFNTKTRRNAASVHLMYPLADSVKVVAFYNELTIPEHADALHSYYMACGFARGYFGMQVNSPTERRIIFSVWDAGNEAIDRNKVSDENKVQLMAKGQNVFADGFGNEGTGGHSHWIYNWKTGTTYKFLVTAVTDSAASTTSYAGYFYIPEEQHWKLIACFKAPKDGKPLRKLYSFVENFWGVNGQLLRKAFYGNQWVRTETGEWKELTQSTFSYDATGRAGDRIDYGGGVENNQFYLWNGGFKTTTTKFGDVYNRQPNNAKPQIDFYKNADSAAEIKKELAVITDAIANKTITVTGSSNNVYYTILKEGDGPQVTVNDTLVVNYRGTLWNGAEFDATADKPATFPLKRLIKGWQLGMPYCKQGGKIRLYIPSPLAYSIRNLGVIPPNSILIFDVEVLEIKAEGHSQ